jgi:hypothetical protein
MGAEHELVAT